MSQCTWSLEASPVPNTFRTFPVEVDSGITLGTVRSATLVTLAASLSALFVVVACAGTEDAPPEEQTQEAPQQPSTIPTGSSTPSSTSEPVKKCVAKCTTDSECANSCPSTPTGAHCCDTSGVCYKSPNSVCKKEEQDSGTEQPQY